MDTTNLWRNDNCLKDFFLKYMDVQLVSIDVFDTLILRNVSHPMDIFKILGKRCKELGYINQDMTESGFANIRYEAENTAIRKIYKKDYVNIYEIYSCLPPYMRNKDRILDLEVQIEKEYCYINWSMYSFLRELHMRNIPVVLTSDIYFSSKQILDILSVYQFNSSLVSNIYTSSEAGYTKKNGRLFKVLQKEYAHICPQNIIHIGDNYETDCLMAKISGMRYLHYDVISENKLNLFEFERLYSDITISHMCSLRKWNLNLNPYKDSEYEEWFKIGSSIIGPMLAVYCDYIVEYIQKNEIKYIYPIMREGKIIGDIIECALKQTAYKIYVKPLYTSRQAILLPSLYYEFEELLSDVLNGPMTVGELFTLFGFRICNKEFENIENEGLYQLSNYNRERLFAYFSKQCIKEKILFKAKKELLKFEQYLREFRFDKRFLFLDIGFSGTVMRAMNCILDHNNIDSELIYNMLIFGGIKLGSSKIKIDYVEQKECLNDLMLDYLEEFLNDYRGSVEGYIRNKLLITPKLKDNNVSDWQKKGIQIGQEGIKQFCYFYFQLNERVKRGYASQLHDMNIIFKRLIDFPNQNEYRLLGAIQHCNDYGNNNYNIIIGSNVVQNMSFYRTYDDKKTLINYYYIKQYLHTYDMEIIISKVYKKYTKVYVYTLNKDVVNLLRFFCIDIIAILENSVYWEGMDYQNIPIKCFATYLNQLDRKIPVVCPVNILNEIKSQYLSKMEEKEPDIIFIK